MPLPFDPRQRPTPPQKNLSSWRTTCGARAVKAGSEDSDHEAAALAFLATLHSYVFLQQVMQIVEEPLPVDATSTPSSTSGRGESFDRRPAAKGRKSVEGDEPMKRKGLVLLLLIRLPRSWRAARSRLPAQAAETARALRHDRGAGRRGRAPSWRGRVAKVLVDGGVAGRGQSADRPARDRPDRLPDSAAAVARRAGDGARSPRPLRGPRAEEIARARATAETAERERGASGERCKREGHRRAGGVRRGHDSGDDRGRDAARAGARLPPRRHRRRARRGRRGREATRIPEAAAPGGRGSRPGRGVIESMDLRPGDLVAPNQPVAKILEPSQLWVRVYVPEPQLGRVRVGQKAALAVDTFPKREFPGTRRRDPDAVRVHAAQRPDARPADGPGLRREGGRRAGRGASAGHGRDRSARRLTTDE